MFDASRLTLTSSYRTRVLVAEITFDPQRNYRLTSQFLLLNLHCYWDWKLENNYINGNHLIDQENCSYSAPSVLMNVPN
jgi:hypothetical protein